MLGAHHAPASARSRSAAIKRTRAPHPNPKHRGRLFHRRALRYPRVVPVRDLRARASKVAHAAPEPLTAIALGVLFTALGILGVVEGKALSEVTLLVLSALALSTTRDRVSRGTVSDRLGELDKDVQSLLSGEPYYVLQYTSAMDIRHGGTEAYATRTKKIRFDQNSVLSISDFSESTGTSESYSCSPKPLKRVGEFRTGARLHSLISLGRPWNRGEQLEFTIQEKLRDAFLADREDLTVDVTNPMDTLVLSVTWPADRGVENIFVERFGRQTPIATSDLRAARDGRPWYTRSFDHPQLGETISVVWDYA